MSVVDEVVKVLDKDKLKQPRVSNPELITEISLRTGAIAIYLAKVKQYANKVDSGVMKLKTLSNSLKGVATDEERNKLEGEIVRVDADVLMALRKMQMYSALVSASGGLGAAKETAKLIKKMEKRKRR